MTDPWDCIVVGGGAAGLSAALVLGRARRRTLVLDAGGQSNRPAEGIGGLLGHDHRPPAELYAAGRAELASYPTVEVRDATVTDAAAVDGGFTVRLADGREEGGRRVVLATGMDYRLPAVEGLAERWGRSVFHCPFCHGWEVRDRRLAVLDANPETGVHRALLLRAWSDAVALLTDGPSRLGDEDRRRLAAAGVEVTSDRSQPCGETDRSWTRSCSPTGRSGRAAGCWWPPCCTSGATWRRGSASPPPRPRPSPPTPSSLN